MDPKSAPGYGQESRIVSSEQLVATQETFIDLIQENLNNPNLTDSQFRQFVRNTIRVIR